MVYLTTPSVIIDGREPAAPFVDLGPSKYQRSSGEDQPLRRGHTQGGGLAGKHHTLAGIDELGVLAYLNQHWLVSVDVTVAIAPG